MVTFVRLWCWTWNHYVRQWCTTWPQTFKVKISLLCSVSEALQLPWQALCSCARKSLGFYEWIISILNNKHILKWNALNTQSSFQRIQFMTYIRTHRLSAVTGGYKGLRNKSTKEPPPEASFLALIKLLLELPFSKVPLPATLFPFLVLLQ